MRITRKRPQGRALVALPVALALTLLAALLPAAALAAAKPGTPTANTPKGAIATTTPSFAWSKAKGAARYELRVYQGSTQVLKMSALARLSCKSGKALPTNVALTWKVRASNTAGVGAWSRSLAFTVATASSAKAITAFSFQGLTPPVDGVITEAAHTIVLTVPHGADVSARMATFTTTGASVKVGAVVQVSGVTANDFTSPVTYTVTAADASTQDYVVTVTFVLAIGDPYQGGIVAYIVQPGDPGYVAGETHGLIAATADQSPSCDVPWATEPYRDAFVPGTSTDIGTGLANTNAIVAQNGPLAMIVPGPCPVSTRVARSSWARSPAGPRVVSARRRPSRRRHVIKTSSRLRRQVLASAHNCLPAPRQRLDGHHPGQME